MALAGCGLSSTLRPERGHLGCASPGKGHASSAVAVVVNHLNTIKLLRIDSYACASRTQADSMAEDASISYARLDLRAATNDRYRGGWIGLAAPITGLGDAAKDDHVALGCVVQEVG